jgi:DNA replicative helicase MCM subunit Mcm2 (Cdc46/Mcm family)
MITEGLTPGQKEVAKLVIKSVLATLPRKRKFADRILIEILKRTVDLTAERLLEASSVTTPVVSPRPSVAFDIHTLQSVRTFATQMERRRYTVYDRLLSMIAPHLEGASDLKLALCYTLASTPDYPVHMVMIGEPATVKTELLEEARNITPAAVLAGPRSTLPGLTVNLSNGSLGLLTKANGSLALVDELDKLPDEAIKSLYESMESGRITVNSGKISREFESKFICIATANPGGNILRNHKGFVRQQLLRAIPAALLSRFHLAFVLRQPTGTQLDKTVKKILVRNSRSNPNAAFLANYFGAIKQICPVVKCELNPNSALVKKAQKFISNKISDSYNGRLGAPLSVRSAEALRRLCISSARMRLSPQVEDVDIENALSIMTASLDTWSVAH